MEDLGVNGKILLKCIFKNRVEDMKIMNVIQDKYKLRALVIAVKKLGVLRHAGKFSSSYSRRTLLHAVR